MTSPGADRYLSAAFRNKSLPERLRDLEAMVEAITDCAIIQLDANGDVARWCPGAEAMTGYSAAEALGRPAALLYTSEDRAAGLAERELAAARESGRCEFEGWRARKNGQRFRAGVALSVFTDDAGSAIGFTTVMRDVTAEHQRAETMFHALLESAPDAMVIVGPDGRIVLANAQADQMFGYPREELIGREVEILIPPRHRGSHERYRTGFFAAPAARRMGAGLELWGMRCDGTVFPVDVSLSPLQTEQGVMVSAAIRDITEQLAVQAELTETPLRPRCSPSGTGSPAICRTMPSNASSPSVSRFRAPSRGRVRPMCSNASMRRSTIFTRWCRISAPRSSTCATPKPMSPGCGSVSMR